MGAVLGRGGAVTWVWGRDGAGAGMDARCGSSITRDELGQPAGFSDRDCTKTAAWFTTSILTNPRGLEAHTQAVLRLQRHAASFEMLSHARPRLWLLQSRTSARMSEQQAEVRG